MGPRDFHLIHKTKQPCNRESHPFTIMAHRSPSTQIHVSGLKQEEPVDTLVENINDDIPGPEFRHIRRKIDIRVTLMLAFMYIANQLDRGNVSFA